MTTVQDFAEHRISRRRCDPSNDIETPFLIEAPGSIGATSRENVQKSTDDEEPSIPFPTWLMLVILVTQFVSTAFAIRFLQTSGNKENWSFLFPIGGVIYLLFISVILIKGIFARLMVVHDVKAGALFLTFLTVGIILGLGMATMLVFTTAPDSTREQRDNLPLGFLFFSIVSSFAAVHECKRDDKTAHLRWSRYYYSYLGFSLGWMIGVDIGMVTGLVLAHSIQG
jgi:hypothetical protein